MEEVVAKAGSKRRVAEEKAKEEEEEDRWRSSEEGRAKSLRRSRRCESKLSISPLLS